MSLRQYLVANYPNLQRDDGDNEGTRLFVGYKGPLGKRAEDILASIVSLYLEKYNIYEAETLSPTIVMRMIDSLRLLENEILSIALKTGIGFVTKIEKEESPKNETSTTYEIGLLQSDDLQKRELAKAAPLQQPEVLPQSTTLSDVEESRLTAAYRFAFASRLQKLHLKLSHDLYAVAKVTGLAKLMNNISTKLIQNASFEEVYEFAVAQFTPYRERNHLMPSEKKPSRKHEIHRRLSRQFSGLDLFIAAQAPDQDSKGSKSPKSDKHKLGRAMSPPALRRRNNDAQN